MPVDITINVEGWFSGFGGALPVNQSQTAGSVTLQGTELPGGAPYVSYAYQLGSSGSAWNLVPTSASGGLSAGDSAYPVPSTWPVKASNYSTVSGSAAPAHTFAPYSWNLADMFGQQSQLVQIEACFGSSSTATTVAALSGLSCTVPQSVTYSPGSAATAPVGPGSVSLQNGDFSLSAVDASIAGGTGTLSIGRTLSTLVPAAKSGSAGVFGAGWTAALQGPSEGEASLTVTGTPASGNIIFADSTGDASVYQITGSTSAISYPTQLTGVGTAASNGNIVKLLSATSLQMVDPDGSITAWAYGSGVWTVSSVQAASSAAATMFSYTNGLVSRITDPAPAGVNCTSSPDTTVGCRSLVLNYATQPTASGTETVKTSVYLSAPQTSGTANKIAVEAYDYYPSGANAGLLRDAYDPRISPALKTVYDYVAGSARLATLTPPGQATWTLGYNSAGKLVTASRPDPNGGTATTTVVYGVPLSGSGLPNLSSDSSGTAQWGEIADLPVTATAVFPPSHVPASQSAAQVRSNDWAWASIDYLDVNGAQVNDASYGAGQWLVDTSQYDGNGNEIWSLTAANRAIALGTQTTGDAVLTSSYAAGAPRAAMLESQSIYNATDPAEKLETLGPLHPIMLADGSQVEGQDETQTTYYSNQPGTAGTDPTNGAVTTGFDLPASSTAEVFVPSTQTTKSAFPNATTTVYGYGAVGSMGSVSGYALGTPTTIRVQMGATPSSADLVTTNEYNAQGQIVAQSLPASTVGTGPQTQLTSYYTATGSGSCVYPAWAGQVCQTAPASQPTSGQTVPTTGYGYDQFGGVHIKTQSSGSTTRTTTNTFDAAGRQVGTVTTMAPENGSVMPAVTYAYDSSTGLPVSASTGSGSSLQKVTQGFNSVGEETSYTDANGQTTTTSYDLNGNPVTVQSPSGTVTYSYGTDFTSAGGVEYRNVVTSENIGVSGQPSLFGASYDAAGNVSVLTYPNGLTAPETYDETNQPVSLKYAMGSSTWMAFSATVGEGGQVAAQSAPGETDTFSYDADGRLVQSQAATAATSSQGQQCTTTKYSFDADSNRTGQNTSVGSGGVCGTTTQSSTASTFDSADRITNTGYVYDPLGRTTQLPAVAAQGQGAFAGVTGVLQVSYFDNDMVYAESQGSQRIIYTLDPLQDRVATESIGTGSSAVRMVNDYSDSSDSPSSTTTGGVATWNVSGPDGGLAATVTQGVVTLQLANMTGSIVATAVDSTTDTGIQSGSYVSFDPYGAPQNAAAVTQTYGWEGANERSAASLGGLILMGVRLYNPSTGRFLTPDSVYGGNANPYVYPTNPLSNNDLTGKLSWWQELLVQAAVRLVVGLVATAGCASEFVGPMTCMLMSVFYVGLAGAISSAMIAKANGKSASAVKAAFFAGGITGGVRASLLNNPPVRAFITAVRGFIWPIVQAGIKRFWK